MSTPTKPPCTVAACERAAAPGRGLCPHHVAVAAARAWAAARDRAEAAETTYRVALAALDSEAARDAARDEGWQ
jgi:hypothetical protein